MCGRYTLSAGETELLERFQVDDVFMETGLVPRFNIAPTQRVPVILTSAGRRLLTMYKWGLVPFWIKDLAQCKPMFNARAESLAEKPFFKTALSRRRCVIPADGFYEWQVTGASGSKKLKTPLWIHSTQESGAERIMAFAGLYDKWKKPDGTLLETCTIVTTSANATMAPVHDRMPVILSPGAETLWLDESTQDTATLQSVLNPAPDNVISMFAVGTRVNKASEEGADLIAPVSRSIITDSAIPSSAD